MRQQLDCLVSCSQSIPPLLGEFDVEHTVLVCILNSKLNVSFGTILRGELL